jgi:hypothetical protein
MAPGAIVVKNAEQDNGMKKHASVQVTGYQKKQDEE